MAISSGKDVLQIQTIPMNAKHKIAAQLAVENPGFIGTINPGEAPIPAAATAKTVAATITPTTQTPEDEFMAMMGKNPAQAMQDRWLEAHGITKDKLAAMTPEEYKKVMDQMKQEVELQIKEALNKNQIKQTNFSLLT